jgi:hypothetical protein
MLGANPATRALTMPEQLISTEMQEVERRLGWLPATLIAAARTFPRCTNEAASRPGRLRHKLVSVEKRRPRLLGDVDRF